VFYIRANTARMRTSMSGKMQHKIARLLLACSIYGSLN